MPVFGIVGFFYVDFSRLHCCKVKIHREGKGNLLPMVQDFEKSFTVLQKSGVIGPTAALRRRPCSAHIL